MQANCLYMPNNLTLSLVMWLREKHDQVNFITHFCYCYFIIETVTQEDVTQEDLGGAKTHTSVSGENKVFIHVCTYNYVSKYMWQDLHK